MEKKIGNYLVIGILALIFIPMMINNCSEKKQRAGYTSSAPRKSYTYQEEGLDKVIKSLRDVSDYTIVLYDMNAEGSKYYHQYQVLTSKSDSTIDKKETEWLSVSESFFRNHVDNLGMEVAHKTNNVLAKETAPAGYSQYVGNPQYGHWEQRNGSSFWAFYGKFAFMSSMFNLVARPAYRDNWYDYNRNYRGHNRTYYGTNGYYGTKSYTASNGKNTSWAKQPQSFKDNVRSKVKSSSSSSRASAQRSTVNQQRSSQQRTSRSSSRYSSSGSRRSSGGFGGGGK